MRLRDLEASFDTRLGFAAALLRMRSGWSWHKEDCLILSATPDLFRGEQSKDAGWPIQPFVRVCREPAVRGEGLT